MKKLLSLFLTVLLLTAGLSACKEQSLLSPDAPVTLTMWHVYGEQADSPMNRLIEEFNSTTGREKGVLVTVTNVSSTSKIGNQLLDAQANAPGAALMPDLFSCHTTTAVSLGSDNLIDWTKHFSQEELSSFVPAFIEDGTMDGRLAVFPVSKSSYALFINGSQFERFSADTGITYDALSTWDGFFEAAAKYYDWSDGKTFCAFDYLIRHVELDVLSKKAALTYTEDGWYDFDSQSLKDSWMMFAKPLVQGHIAVADLYANTQVMTGEALAGIGSTAAITYYNDTVTYPDNTSEPMDLHVLPLPRSDSDEQFMPQTGVGISAYQTTEQKAEAAAVFLRWFTEGARNLDFVVETGYIPVNKTAFDAVDTYNFPDSGYASLYQAIRTMLDDYTPVVRPDFNGYYNKVNALYDGLRSLQTDAPTRIKSGENADVLMDETWDLFQSIQ